MQAFGREVASRTIAGVLSALILLALGAGWQFIAPALASRLNITFREAFAWVIAAIAVVALAIVMWLLRRKPASLALTLNNGTKPSVTLTNLGGATTYRADGRIVSHVDGTQTRNRSRGCHWLEEERSKRAFGSYELTEYGEVSVFRRKGP